MNNDYQHKEVEDAARQMLAGFGVDPNDPGLQDTPKRVAKSWAERLSGYRQHPGEILSRQFPADGYDQMVVLTGIDFHSVCEHHLLPFAGTATVGYIPGDGVIVGLSKLARVVDCFARRLQVQERLTEQVAAAVQEHLSPVGVGVMVKASHQCMVCRGVQKSGGQMVTSVLLGRLRDDSSARAEFLSLASTTV